MTTEDARSDFILAAAANVLGLFIAGFVASLPLYPDGLLRDLLSLAWIWGLTGLVPLLLARYRGDVGAAFGLDADRSALGFGILLAVPVVAQGIVRGLSRGGLVQALLGRFSSGGVGNPVIADPATASVVPVELAFDAAFTVVLWLGGFLLFTFLTLRAASGFRRTDLGLAEAIRTFGLGAAGVALVLGLLTAVSGRVSFLSVLLNIAALVAIVLIADRVAAPDASTSRATVLAPAIVAIVAHVLATGGVFGGNLLLGLYAGALAGGIVIVIAVLVEARHAWAVVPLLAAVAFYPTCLSPLAFELGTAC